MTRRSGQSLATDADATCLIDSTRCATCAVLTLISGVPTETSAAASTCAGVTRCVPDTVTERTTISREPNSAHATPARTPRPASMKNAVRHGLLCLPPGADPPETP